MAQPRPNTPPRVKSMKYWYPFNTFNLSYFIIYS